MTKFNTQDEMKAVIDEGIDLLESLDIDKEKDGYTLIRTFDSGQAIIIRAVEEDGRTIKVEVSDAVVVLQSKKGTLDIYTGGE